MGDTNTTATLVSATIAPDNFFIDSIDLTETTVTMDISVDPTDWMPICADELRVRAGSTLPLPSDDSALVDPSQVSVVLNADGTATVSLPRPTAPATFYRIEVE